MAFNADNTVIWARTSAGSLRPMNLCPNVVQNDQFGSYACAAQSLVHSDRLRAQRVQPAYDDERCRESIDIGVHGTDARRGRIGCRSDDDRALEQGMIRAGTGGGWSAFA